jgi:diaminopimelate epimerase
MIEAMGSLVQIRKYHGLGNDFLVLLDVEGHRWSEGGVPGGAAALARAACNRHRGIGADGLLIVSDGPLDGSADVTMRLHNADGSIAEMSGNGIRCFSQAVVDAGIAPRGTLRVQTDAGLRVVEVGETNADGIANIRVDMGIAKMDAFEIPAPVQALVKALGDSSARVATVDVGNPHLIVGVDAAIVDVASFDIASFGVRVEEHFMDAFGGINVHVVARVEPRPNEPRPNEPRLIESGPEASSVEPSVDVLAMTIWERGVGITEACGTGATAVAVAAHGWGWVGPICELRQPGGSARVEIVGEQLTLIGPSQLVATSDFAWNQ